MTNCSRVEKDCMVYTTPLACLVRNIKSTECEFVRLPGKEAAISRARKLSPVSMSITGASVVQEGGRDSERGVGREKERGRV